MAIQFLNNQYISGTLEVAGATTFDTVANPGSDTDKFVVINGSGLLGFRTGAELLADIGGSSSATTVTSVSGTQPIISSGGLTPTISLNYTGANNLVESATDLEGNSIATADSIIYNDATDGNVKKGLISDLPFSNTSGTVTSITPGADSGTGTAITTSGTITVAGGSNITTSVSGTTIIVNTDFNQYGWSITDGSTTNSIPSGTTVTWQGGTGINTSLNGYILDIEIDSSVIPSGSGTSGKLAKWTGANTLGDGPVTISGNDSTFAGKILASNDAPAFAFASDTETGMARTGTHQIAFKNNDVDSLTLAADLSATFAGNVGIGMTAGTIPTEIKGRASDGKSLRLWDNAGTDILDLYNNGTNAYINTTHSGGAGNPLIIQTNSLTALTLDTSQNATFAGSVTVKSGNKLILNRPNNAVASEISTDASGTMILNSVNDEGFKFQNAGTTFLTLDTSDNATFAGDILTNTDSSSDIGKTATRWANIWVDNINGGTPTTGGPYLPLAGGTLTGNSALSTAGTATFTIESSGANGNNVYLALASSDTEWRWTTNRGDQISGNQGDLFLREDTAGVNALIFETNTGNATFAGDITANSIFLPDNRDIGWNGGYSASKPTLAAVGTTMKMFPSGATSGAQFTLTPTNATFAGNVELKSDAGNATKHLRIWNQGTAANDDAVLSWTAQASRTYSMGIHRDSGNLVISNADASVASGDLLNINNSGNATFAGTITASKNQNATSSFTFQNTDTTGTSVRTHLNATAGNRSIRLEAIHNDYSYVVSNNARMYLQTNSGSNNTLFLDGNNATFAGTVSGTTATFTTFSGDLNGTINTATTAVTKGNAVSDTTVATTAFVQNVVGTIPAGLVFQGTWNASTNTPTLASGSGTTGHFYIVSVAGSTNLDGVTDWEVGDWAVFIEQGASDQWEKIDNSSVLGGSGSGGSLTAWAGSGTSVTLTNAPVTYSGNNTTFAGTIGSGAITSTGRVTGTQGYFGTGFIHESGGYATFGSNSSSEPIAISIDAVGSTAALKIETNNNATFSGTVEADLFKVEQSNTSTNVAASSDYGIWLKNTSDTDGNFIPISFSNSTGFETARIGAQFQDAGDRNTDLFFMTRANGGGLTEQLRISSTGVATFTDGATFHKIQTYYDGSYTSGFKFSDYNGGIWYDAGNDDLILNGGHANSQVIIKSGGGNTALTLDSGLNATFAGNLIIHDGSNAPYIDFVESGAITDSKARITMDQVDTNNGQLLFSTEKAGTLTTALTINQTQDATFAGDVTIGSTGAGSDKILNILTGGSDSTIKLMEAGTIYGFSQVYSGANNQFYIKRHSNSATGSAVITLNRDNDNATFAGNIRTGTSNFAENIYGFSLILIIL